MEASDSQKLGKNYRAFGVGLLQDNKLNFPNYLQNF